MRKIISIILLAMIVLSSCKKTEQLGPDLDGIYGPVTVVQPFAVSTTSVNFATGGQVYFTAQFQNDAVWTITITGTTSHAIKTITGLSKTISIENSLWTGIADGAPSFQVENVTAVLSFKNSPTLVETIGPIAITGTRIADLPTDVLVTDFQTIKPVRYGSVPTIPRTSWPIDFPYFSNSDTSHYGHPDGNTYVVMGNAKPTQGGGSPYVDVMTIYPEGAMHLASQTPYSTYFPLYADPTKVYFNIMVYNTGTPTWLQISMIEDGQVARYINVKPNWTGWKLISVKYSDFVANSTAFATNVQTQKVNGVQIVLLSNVPVANNALLISTLVSTAFDHITFTNNAPYQP